MLKKFLFAGVFNWSAFKRYGYYSTNGNRSTTVFPDKNSLNHFPYRFLFIKLAHSTGYRTLAFAHKDNCYIQA